MVYEEPLDDAGRLLVLALRARRTSSEDERLEGLYRRLGSETVHRIAEANQVFPLVADALDRVLPPADVPTAWRDELAANAARVKALFQAAGDVTDHLEGEGIPVAAVEGGGVMLASELPYRAFCSGDLDLMVPRGRLADAVRLAGEEGFVPAKRTGRDASGRAELRKSGPDGEPLRLEIGSAPFDRAWIPMPHGDRLATWLDRRVPSPRARAVPVLATEDALAFVCVHTSLHGYVRAPGLRLHVDVDRIVTDAAVDWEAFLDEIRALGLTTRAFVSLAMAAGLLGTTVPPHVLDALHPGAGRWRAIRALLTSAGVLADRGRGLGPARLAALEALLDDRGPLAWARSAALPSPDWLREHFDRDRSFPGPTWMLHVKRAWRLVGRSRP